MMASRKDIKVMSHLKRKECIVSLCPWDSHHKAWHPEGQPRQVGVTLAEHGEWVGSHLMSVDILNMF